jgi:hypothetical protein
MNRLKKNSIHIKTIWHKLNPIQKLILFGITGVVIIGIIMLFLLPRMVPVFSEPIKDDIIITDNTCFVLNNDMYNMWDRSFLDRSFRSSIKKPNLYL